MEQLKQIIISSFFTHPIMLLSALFAWWLGFMRGKKSRELKYLLLYPLASFIQGLIAYYSWVHQSEQVYFRMDLISESEFILIEFLILHYFFKNIITLSSLKLLMEIVYLTYTLYLLIIWIFTATFYQYPSTVYLLQAFYS